VLIKSKYGDITLEKAEKHDFEDIVTLHASVHEPSDPDIIGTEFVLNGVSKTDISNAKDLFLIFSGDKILENTSMDQFLQREEKLPGYM